MRLIKWLAYQYRFWFQDGCLDPDCPGTLIPYSDRVKYDTCDTCGRSYWELEAATKTRK